MNIHSSRSHALLCITVTGHNSSMGVTTHGEGGRGGGKEGEGREISNESNLSIKHNFDLSESRQLSESQCF